MRRALAALSLASLVSAPAAEAGDFYDNGYLLRLALALTRASNYAETAGRQASIAYPGGSSVNPAAGAALSAPRMNATATTIQAFSQSGAHIGAYAATANLPVNDTTVASIAYAYTDTYDGETERGLEDLLRSDELFLGFSHRLTPTIPIGLQVRLVNSTIHDESTTLAGLPLANRARVRLQSAGAAVGIQTDLGEGLRWGAQASFGYGEGESKLTNLDPILLPFGLPPIPAGSDLGQIDDSVRTYGAGMGLAYASTPSSTLLADITYVTIDSNEGGSASQTRLAIGGETRINDAWALRAGWSYDSADQATYSVGLGARLAQGLRLDVAYQYNATPEIEPEFGTMKILSASLALEL